MLKAIEDISESLKYYNKNVFYFSFSFNIDKAKVSKKAPSCYSQIKPDFSWEKLT
jgi:hypothetical protein